MSALRAVPFIVTVNPSTENLEFLRSYPRLAQEENCVLLELGSIAFEDPGSGVESGAESENCLHMFYTVHGLLDMMGTPPKMTRVRGSPQGRQCQPLPKSRQK